MKTQKLLICFVSFIALLALGGCQLSENTMELDLADNFTDFESLTQASPVIVTARVEGNAIPFNYTDVSFYRAELKLLDVVRDETNGLKKDDTITLLQNDLNAYDSLVVKNENVLLYLRKYEGPVIENAYIIVGLSQGHFRIEKDEKLTSKVTKQQDQTDSVAYAAEGKTLADVIKMANEIAYVPEKRTVLTDEEIEELNRQEMELYEQSKKDK